MAVFFFLFGLFIYDLHFYYFLDKFWVLNEILKPSIFIFKCNTNIMSIHINVEFHNTIFDDMHYKSDFKISVSKI